ncbi:MAG TPA: hypothetical protein VJZ76_04405 [Thermoanaerobaculia bacterium]|nr:hypothetical protein [Thermoanaerobaculia bacterium]
MKPVAAVLAAAFWVGWHAPLPPAPPKPKAPKVAAPSPASFP